MNGNIDLLPKDLELVDGGGPLEVRRDQQRTLAAFHA